MQIGNTVAQEPVEFCAFQNAPFGDSDFPQKLLITGMAMVPKAVAIKFGKE